MKQTITILFFLVLSLIAFVSAHRQRGEGRCDYDGNRIEPINRVVISLSKGGRFEFCSLCCARSWLENGPARDAKDGTITVVDEVSGEEIDGSLAYWVESRLFTVRENGCGVHAFLDPGDAARHIRDYSGAEQKGYLAGQGRGLPWAPNFMTTDVDDGMIDLIRYRGKVVFLRFWNSANPFTEKDLGYLKTSYLRWRDQGFVVLAVNVQQRKRAVDTFVAGLDLPFPVLLDPNGQIADLYKIKGYPTGFLVDRSGIIRNQSIGEILPEMMEPLLAPLL